MGIGLEIDSLNSMFCLYNNQIRKSSNTLKHDIKLIYLTMVFKQNFCSCVLSEQTSPT